MRADHAAAMAWHVSVVIDPLLAATSIYTNEDDDLDSVFRFS